MQTSIIKTFKNDKGCGDNKQKKGKNKVGMSGMRRPLEWAACRNVTIPISTAVITCAIHSILSAAVDTGIYSINIACGSSQRNGLN